MADDAPADANLQGYVLSGAGRPPPRRSDSDANVAAWFVHVGDALILRATPPRSDVTVGPAPLTGGPRSRAGGISPSAPAARRDGKPAASSSATVHPVRLPNCSALALCLSARPNLMPSCTYISVGCHT